MIIGTAGHIDHGKTALIKALTGRDTDRLAEEKRRGITIDLGFTWFDLDDGTRCGIIDVPGHERFIANMVTGVTGMDLVLVVVAADEGIMPQTREHLDILQLLGVQKGILVISKCDLADQEWLDLMEEEIRGGLKGSILDGAPAVRVSSVTGFGIAELKNLIGRMVRDEVQERDANGIPRLPVDRVFTLQGFGTVVTGTLLSGALAKNDEVQLYPTDKICKIRGMQVHEQNRDICLAGQRAALNLSNIKKNEIRRGYCLAPADSMKISGLLDVRLQLLSNSPRLIENRQRLHLFIGTSEVLCRAVLLDCEKLEPGGECLAQLILEEKLAVRRGDRFVVRYYSPLQTIGGGVVLDAAPGRKRRFRTEVLEDLRRRETGSLADIAEMQIRDARDSMISLADLARNTAHNSMELIPYLQELEDAGQIESYQMTRETWYWHSDTAFMVRKSIAAVLQEYHCRYPYRLGMNKASVYQSCLKKVKVNVFDEIIQRMVRKGYFRQYEGKLMLPDFEVSHDEVYQDVRKLLTDAFETAAYEMLRFSEIEKKGYPDEMVLEILTLLIEEGICVRVGNSLQLYTMKHFMDEAEKMIRNHFEQEEILTFTQVREMLRTNRKCAKPIVEYMDSRKITKRVGAETERIAYN